ncbi:MAG: radical SAM protein [Candidatus Bathyarchaeia archaeon]
MSDLHNVIGYTTSLCPECLRILDAEIYEKEGKVWISKECPEHGVFDDLYWGSYEQYKRAQKYFWHGRPVDNPQVNVDKPVCPFSCGLCSMHIGHTALANIVVTNRCDLSCWYCFFYAEKAGYVYEPSLEQIRSMVRVLRSEKPIPCNAVQLTGGEPALRDDLPDIIRVIREEGVEHVQVNTDGIRLALDPDLASVWRRAGANTIYLSYDGPDRETNPKNYLEAPKAIENCRRCGFTSIVLVPTVIKTVNDHIVGGIVRYAIENMDVVRGVNFQPVSLVGRMPRSERMKYRITIPDLLEELSDQLDGVVTPEDFYPVPACMPISWFVEALSGRPRYELSSHFACGMATYVFKDGGKLIPLPRFFDIDGFLEYLLESTDRIKKGRSRLFEGFKLLFKLSSFIDKDKAPRYVNIARLVFNIFVMRNYSALADFHYKTLFIGMMHFQDLYNYDIERVKRCVIHYTLPDGRVVPFCAFNVIPQLYRDSVQRMYGLPIDEWERIKGRRIREDFYRRVEVSV